MRKKSTLNLLKWLKPQHLNSQYKWTKPDVFALYGSVFASLQPNLPSDILFFYSFLVKNNLSCCIVDTFGLMWFTIYLIYCAPALFQFKVVEVCHSCHVWMTVFLIEPKVKKIYLYNTFNCDTAVDKDGLTVVMMAPSWICVCTNVPIFLDFKLESDPWLAKPRGWTAGKLSPPNDFWAPASSSLQYAARPRRFGWRETREVTASDNGFVFCIVWVVRLARWLWLWDFYTQERKCTEGWLLI